jgi:hypothetical protein
MAKVLDAVSMSTVKVWRGEPTDTLTKYSVRMSLIVTGTWSIPCLCVRSRQITRNTHTQRR